LANDAISKSREDSGKKSNQSKDKEGSIIKMKKTANGSRSGKKTSKSKDSRIATIRQLKAPLSSGHNVQNAKKIKKK
jgi:hypothetical protein